MVTQHTIFIIIYLIN